MKKIYIFILLFAFPLLVNAECDYRTQNIISTDAANVKVDYEIGYVVGDAEGNLYPEISADDIYDANSPYGLIDQITLNIYNLSDNVYIVLENKEDNLKKQYMVSDMENGNVSYLVGTSDIIREYNIKVYSNNVCNKDEELRTINIKTPKYNNLSSTEICENSDKYYCQKYVTADFSINKDELDYEYNGEDINVSQEKISFFKKYWLALIGTVVIIIAVVVVVIKRRSKDNIHYVG